MRLFGRRTTLAGQMLVLQLGIVLLVLVGVAAVSIAQSHLRDRDTEGRRALSVAENLAAQPVVRSALEQPNDASGDETDETTGPTDLAAARGPAAVVAENSRTVSGATYVLVIRPDRRVLIATDPTRLTTAPMVQSTPAFAGASWVGVDEATGAALAMVPVLSTSTRATIGVVAVGRAYPTPWDNLAASVPNLLTYLGIAIVLGVLGSLLLSRRVKRQTMGLEPREIAGLVEHREAMLHGIKEGVIAYDLQRRVTLVNDQAASLLGVSSVSAGQPLDTVVAGRHLLDVLTGPDRGTDLIVPVRGRVVTLNRMPIRSRGRHIGWVATVRDRSELLELQRELDVTRETTDTLRAQAHEFSNQMHIVSGLLDLEEFDELRSYLHRLTADQTTLTTAVTSRVADPALAALLIAKTSLAVERGVHLELDEATSLDPVDEDFATDLSTVLGNLIDNALDALAGVEHGVVRVLLLSAGEEVVVQVRDNGPGVSGDLTERVFSHGFSTKTAADGSIAKRGIGLALVRLVCRRRGGEVSVASEGGAVFRAVLPRTARVAEEGRAR